ncbi:MAG: hypothetical protein HYX27_27710 [Acidobacteria bacterium]|nr:hypothetical protein [Acidobacteriota bacterium]
MSLPGRARGRALVESFDEMAQKYWYRFVNKAGKVAFAGEFSEVLSFKHGLANVRLSENRRWKFAWIDTAGRRVMTYVED